MSPLKYDRFGQNIDKFQMDVIFILNTGRSEYHYEYTQVLLQLKMDNTQADPEGGAGARAPPFLPLREDVKIHNHWLEPKCCSIQQLFMVFPI